MPWVKLDDAYFRNPKVTAVKPLARLLYVASLCHCADTLTNGEVHKRDLKLLHFHAGSAPKHVQQLTANALWIEHQDSYWIPDYLAYNPSRDQVLKAREAGLLRANRSRNKRDGSRERARERAPLVRATPTPSPLVSSTDYENNAVHEPFAAKPPTDIRSKIRQAL